MFRTRGPAFLAAGALLCLLSAGSADAMSGPATPPPKPPSVPPRAPASLPTGLPSASQPVTEAPQPTVSLRGGAMNQNGKRLYLSWRCQPGTTGSMTLVEGGLRADQRYGTLYYRCSTGVLGTFFHMPGWMTNAIRSAAGAPAAIRVSTDGQLVPTMFGLRLRLPAAARAAGWWSWAPDFVRADCWTGSLVGETANLGITVSRAANFGAPVDSHIYWRAYAWDATRQRWMWGRPRDYYTRPLIYNGGSNFVRDGEIWTPLGTGGDGTDTTPEVLLIQPRAWIWPGLTITVPSTGLNAFNYLYITSYSSAGYNPGLAVYPTTGRPAACGFGY